MKLVRSSFVTITFPFAVLFEEYVLVELQFSRCDALCRTGGAAGFAVKRPLPVISSAARRARYLQPVVRLYMMLKALLFSGDFSLRDASSYLPASLVRSDEAADRHFPLVAVRIRSPWFHGCRGSCLTNHECFFQTGISNF